MNPNAKDELIRDVLIFEDLIKSSTYEREISFSFYRIISSLLSNDGYQTILMPHTTDSGIDFICTNTTLPEKLELL